MDETETEFVHKDCNDDYEFAYPIFDVRDEWSHESSPYGSPQRMAVFMVAHCGFFMFNFLNVVCILVFHGYVLQRLHRNHLMQTGLLACAGQMLSCLNSTYRYNKCEEFGRFGHTSVLTGLFAYTFFNYTIMYVFLNRHANKRIWNIKYSWIGHAIWLVITIQCWVVGRVQWETHDFGHFRNYISLSTGFQLLAYVSILREFSYKKTIRFRDGFSVDENVAKRVFQSAIFFIFVAIGCALTKKPVFQYPATGSTFSVMVVVVALVGEMEFMDVYGQPRVECAVDGDDEGLALPRIARPGIVERAGTVSKMKGKPYNDTPPPENSRLPPILMESSNSMEEYD